MPATPPIVSVSNRPGDETVSVTVIVEESVTAIEAALIFAPGVATMLGVAAVLNSNPAGAFKTNVTLLPGPKSFLLPSAMTIGPSVVQAGTGALAAVFAEMLLPPDAPVRITAAEAWLRAMTVENATITVAERSLSKRDAASR